MPAGKPKKFILIVDDEEEIRANIADFLEIENEKGLEYQIVAVQARDGLEATQKLENQHFDVVITDYQMPKMEGGRLIEILRDLNHSKDVPVIVISGHVVADNLMSFHNVRYFAKPFQVQELIDTVLLMISPARNPSGKLNIDAKLLSSIVASARDLLAKAGVQNVQMGTPTLTKDKHAVLGAVSTDINIAGPTFRGSMAFAFDEKLYAYLVSHLEGKKTDVQNVSFKQAGEIGRRIASEVTKALPDMKLQMSIPTALVGYKHWESQPTGAIGMIIPLTTPFGKLNVEVIAHPPKE